MRTRSRKDSAIYYCRDRAQCGLFSLTVQMYPSERAWFRKNGFTVSEMVSDNFTGSIPCVISWADAFKDELWAVTAPYSVDMNENPFQNSKNLAQEMFLTAAKFCTT